MPASHPPGPGPRISPAQRVAETPPEGSTLTIFFPDISSYEAGLTIQPGTVAVIAKATEGTYYRDAQYQNFKAQAARVGAVFSAYHFLKAGDGAAQADYCHAMVGNVPVMLDVETEGASKPSVADCLAFMARMRALGGRVWGVYFPRWYWEQVGGNLALLGVTLVASGYPGHYSDTDPDWKPYGGATPAIWQYTDKQPYGGQRVDFNAFRGTVPQLAALIDGGGTAPAAPTTSQGADDVTPDEHNQLNNVYAATFHGGPSCGRVVPAGQPGGGGNSVFSHLDYITSLLEAQAAKPAQPPVDVNALGAAVAAHLAAGGGASADAIAAAVAKHFAADLAAG
jgi:hypothetical protein